MKSALSLYRILPVTVSVAMHAALLAGLYWGWETAGTEQEQTPRYIEAELVELEASTPEEEAAPEPEPQVIDATAQREEAEQQREEEARRQAEQQRQAEQEQREQEQREREQEQREQEQREQEQREQEQREQERREQERREQERREREAEQQEMQEALAQELEAEQAQLQARKNEEIAQSYTALIADKVEDNWSRPPSARNGMEAELAIQLVPTGRVVGVEVVESSGDSAFDRSAERAVQKAEEFPELGDVPSAVFEQEFRQFILKFKPRDLRQ